MPRGTARPGFCTIGDSATASTPGPRPPVRARPVKCEGATSRGQGRCQGHIFGASGPSKGRPAINSAALLRLQRQSIAVLPGRGLKTMQVSSWALVTIPDVCSHGVCSVSVHLGMARSLKAAQLVMRPTFRPRLPQQPGMAARESGGGPVSASRMAAGSPYPSASRSNPAWYWPASSGTVPSMRPLKSAAMMSSLEPQVLPKAEVSTSLAEILSGAPGLALASALNASSFASSTKKQCAVGLFPKRTLPSPLNVAPRPVSQA
mmetsp:Transcript_24317/g.75649  ORF Transcript_24317/g.75649 Transcript_24317/m.75649 type:complete len:262 (+) Transcript_24317:183-968(+)